MSIHTPMHLVVAVAATLLPAVPAVATPAPPPGTTGTSSFLIGPATRRGVAPGRLADDLAAVGRATGQRLTVTRVLATGDLLVRADRPLAPATSAAVLDRLRRRADVGWAAPEARLHADATPDDTRWAEQWDLHDPLGGVYAGPAWDTGADGAGVTVAVLDTGATTHHDLAAHLVPGYDFVSSAADARDGDGRDPDATDQGDWAEPGDCGDRFRPSSWHGTHVAGTIAATRDNGTGIAGLAPGARIQPVRVLARCGGSTADLVDAIVWASGGTVPGVPDNPTPARVLNLSLGAPGACDPATQAAVDGAVARAWPWSCPPATPVPTPPTTPRPAARACSPWRPAPALASRRPTPTGVRTSNSPPPAGTTSTACSPPSTPAPPWPRATATPRTPAPAWRHRTWPPPRRCCSTPPRPRPRRADRAAHPHRPAHRRPRRLPLGAGVLDVDLALRAATGHPGDTTRVLLQVGVRPGDPAIDGPGVHLAGTLDRLGTGLPDWDPGAYPLHRVDATGPYRTVLTVPGGTELEYKYTLGDWAHVEQDYTDSDAGCFDIDNRRLLAGPAGTTQVVADLTGSFRGVWPCRR
ncbi:S8 family serine peptidase [Micromonospora sp. R77]|nr:S8 family serine peptidase [Micromonospora sp. R77]MCI4065957.1 S8 family serine peptidase [Micromonospora sp. R77]